MAPYNYDRLSAQDMDFLQWESSSGNLPMHVSVVQIYAAEALATPEGGIDFEAIKRNSESALHRLPRYRQKLAWIPGEDRAVWVDDPHFNIDYHMRHTALPRPGKEEQLKRLAARIMERPLDRARPLWETWIVEGLEGGRFATIAKTHHCMLDGASGMNLAYVLMSTSREVRVEEPPRYVPRPPPSGAELRRETWLRRLGAPVRALGGIRDFVGGTEDLPQEVVSRVRAVGELLRWKAVAASETPLNGPVGPHRNYDYLTLPLADIKAVRKALECSVNDVVLAIVTGAVRRFMKERQVRPEGLDFRVSTPVNVRTEKDEGQLGNRVSSWIVRLPVGESDPRLQLEQIRATTRELKHSHQAVAVDMMEQLHEWIPFDIQSASQGTNNMIVSNVPGPQMPLYLMGAELLELFPQAPLMEGMGLAIGVISYNGQVCWGLTADYDRVPDLEHFVAGVRRSFERLAEAAGVRTDAARGAVPRRATTTRRKARRAATPAQGAQPAAAPEPEAAPSASAEDTQR